MLKEIDKKIFAADGIIAVNKDDIIIVFNEAASRITEFNSNEVLARKSVLLFGKESANNSIIKKSLLTGEIFSNISLDINKKNGESLNVSASITPLTQPEQGTIGILIIFRDLNETSSLYSALAEKNQEVLEEKNKLETIFNSLLEGTFTINSDWEITAFNRAAELITGYSASEAIGKKYWEVFLSEDRNEDSLLSEFITDHKQSLLRETTILRKDGSRVLVRINSAPLIDTQNNKT